MRALSHAGSRGGDGEHVYAPVLPTQYGYGLASQKRHVRLVLSSVLAFSIFLRTHVGITSLIIQLIYIHIHTRLTAIFLAAKTSNNPIPIDTYAARIPKTTKADVLDLEFLVSQSLNFEFVVWHAHRALWGIYLDIQVRSSFLPSSLPFPPLPRKLN